MNKQDISKLMSQLSPEDNKKLQDILSDKEKLQKILSTPQAKSLMKQFGMDKN